MIKLSEAIKRGLSSSVIGILKRKRDTRGSSAQRFNILKEAKTWSYVMQGEEASEEINSALTSVLGFRPPEL